MRDLINKLDNIADENTIFEQLEAAGVDAVVYKEIGTIEVDSDATDEQLAEAVDNLFSHWKN